MPNELEQLKRELKELKEQFYNHTHRGYDRSQKINTSTTATPAGSTTEIQLNDAGAFGTASDFTFDKAASGSFIAYLTAGSGANAGGNIEMAAGDGGSTGTGGDVIISAGDAGGAGDGDGGDIIFLHGVKNGTGRAGDTVLGSAVGTSDGGGFVFVPTCAGTPTGTPSTHTGTLAMVYDSTGNKLWVYDGGWIGVALA